MSGRRADEEIALGGGLARNLHKVGVVGGVAAHHGHVPVHFGLLAKQHAGFGEISREENQIGRSGLQLGQNGGVVAFAGRQGVIEHHGHAGGLQPLERLFGKPLGVGGIIVQDGDSLVSLAGDDLTGHAPLLVVARAGTEEQPQPLFSQTDAGGAGGDLDEFGFVDDVLSGLGHGRTVGSDDGDDARGSQFLGGKRRRARIAGVIFDNQLDLVPVDAASLVHVIGKQRDDLAHILPFAGPFPGKRAHQANAHGIRQRRRCGDQHQRDGDQQRFQHILHGSP